MTPDTTPHRYCVPTGPEAPTLRWRVVETDGATPNTAAHDGLGCPSRSYREQRPTQRHLTDETRQPSPSSLASVQPPPGLDLWCISSASFFLSAFLILEASCLPSHEPRHSFPKQT